MSETKFTPGPWTADFPMGCVWVPATEVWHRHVIADTDYPAAKLQLPTEQREANTALIAAAPDMYYALREIVAFIEAVETVSPALEEVLEARLRAALAKARRTYGIQNQKDMP